MIDRERGMWSPCTKGHPDPENCPDCTPPAEERCPEYREVEHYPTDNRTVVYEHEVSTWRYPCRVLGPHTVHRDGRGTSWWVEGPYCAAEAPASLWDGTCHRTVREEGQRCWQHQGQEAAA